MKNILLIGGTNYTAQNIATSFKEMGYSVYGTYRQEELAKGSVDKWNYLDLYIEDTVDKFLEQQKDIKYDKIILLISNSSKPYGESLKFKKEDLINFYGNFCVNYIILINNLIKNLSEEGSVVFISSGSADYGAKDLTYSSGKALIENYVLSLTNFLTDKQYAFSISPGTIKGSRWYNQLPETHEDKINKDLIASPEKIVEIILESNKHNGQIVKLGREW